MPNAWDLEIGFSSKYTMYMSHFQANVDGGQCTLPHVWCNGLILLFCDPGLNGWAANGLKPSCVRVLKEIKKQNKETNGSSTDLIVTRFFQFLTLDSEDERQQLIPVLTTMLKLSPDEKEKLLSIARGNRSVYTHYIHDSKKMHI